MSQMKAHGPCFISSFTKTRTLNQIRSNMLEKYDVVKSSSSYIDILAPDTSLVLSCPRPLDQKQTKDWVKDQVFRKCRKALEIFGAVYEEKMKDFEEVSFSSLDVDLYSILALYQAIPLPNALLRDLLSEYKSLVDFHDMFQSHISAITTSLDLSEHLNYDMPVNSFWMNTWGDVSFVGRAIFVSLKRHWPLHLKSSHTPSTDENMQSHHPFKPPMTEEEKMDQSLRRSGKYFIAGGVLCSIAYLFIYGIIKIEIRPTN
jgi:hypothetical protein